MSLSPPLLSERNQQVLIIIYLLLARTRFSHLRCSEALLQCVFAVLDDSLVRRLYYAFARRHHGVNGVKKTIHSSYLTQLINDLWHLYQIVINSKNRESLRLLKTCRVSMPNPDNMFHCWMSRFVSDQFPCRLSSKNFRNDSIQLHFGHGQKELHVSNRYFSFGSQSSHSFSFFTCASCSVLTTRNSYECIKCR